jgi:tRNA threonylcarbamoyladenosine biosynthesis protein TsaE
MSASDDILDLSQVLENPVRRVIDEEAMQVLGQELAEVLPAKCLLTLSGELGTGKSVLARAIIHALGYEGRVKSPTYTLMETYEVGTADGRRLTLAHLDLYRLTDPAELEQLGFDDVMHDFDLVLIEWPEQGGDRLPAATLHVVIRYTEDDSRVVLLTSG